MIPITPTRGMLGLAFLLSAGQALAQHDGHHHHAAPQASDAERGAAAACEARPDARGCAVGAAPVGGAVRAPAPVAHDHHHGAATPDAPSVTPPRQPIPVPTDADRAAAFPVLSGHASHDQGVYSFLRVNRLEAWDAAPGLGVAWETRGWVGTDRHRLWLRSEGEREHGSARSDLEILYGRPVAVWWDLLAGVRQRSGDGPSSTEAVVGVAGRAPQKFEVEATAFLAPGGHAGARVEVEYEVLLTNRLVLQPLLEAELRGRDDADRRAGAARGRVEAGLRLRYEASRRIAPYVGLVHERRYGVTPDDPAGDGDAARDTRVVAGVRLQF